MSAVCPACRRALDSGPDYLPPEQEAAIVRLRERGRMLGIETGGKIREGNAGQLLEKSGETLRDWRKDLSPDEAPLRYYRDGKGNVYYLLEDLAAFDIGLKK